MASARTGSHPRLRVKFLLDMNLSPHWSAYFALQQIEAHHWSTIGRREAPDDQIMEYAKENRFVVLTQDLDFGTILAATKGLKPSVIQIRDEDLAIENLGRKLLAALTQLQQELEEGALVTVDAKRTRVSVLPLRRGF